MDTNEKIIQLVITGSSEVPSCGRYSYGRTETIENTKITEYEMEDMDKVIEVAKFIDKNFGKDWFYRDFREFSTLGDEMIPSVYVPELSDSGDTGYEIQCYGVSTINSIEVNIVEKIDLR